MAISPGDMDFNMKLPIFDSKSAISAFHTACCIVDGIKKSINKTVQPGFLITVRAGL